jgi:hypothetical protein
MNPTRAAIGVWWARDCVPAMISLNARTRMTSSKPGPEDRIADRRSQPAKSYPKQQGLMKRGSTSRCWKRSVSIDIDPRTHNPTPPEAPLTEGAAKSEAGAFSARRLHVTPGRLRRWYNCGILLV